MKYLASWVAVWLLVFVFLSGVAKWIIIHAPEGLYDRIDAIAAAVAATLFVGSIWLSDRGRPHVDDAHHDQDRTP